MAFFTINDTLHHQKRLFSSLTHCKYSSYLFPTFPTPKHSFSSKTAPVFLATPHINLITSTRTINCSTTRETASGISSIRPREKRVSEKSVEEQGNSVISLVDEEDRGNKKFTHDVFAKNIVRSRNRREMGSGSSSVRSKNSKLGLDSVDETNSILLMNGHKISKNLRKNDGNVEVGTESAKRSDKKCRFDSRETHFRVALEMCSKKGDVMGALDLYDEARREGIKITQYHYTVLLYLCSSAAVGVIYPAKSGSDNRNLNSNVLDSSEDDLGNEETNLSQISECAKANPKALKYPNEEIRVSEETKTYALKRGFKIYERMCLEKVIMNEATLTSVARMAMSMGDGDMAFDMVKQMKPLGINPKLRSYGPSLSTYCKTGDWDKAFLVEKHMLEHGVNPEEPELEALLKVSVEAGKSDKVYYVLQQLRSSVRKATPPTADLIEKWFNSKEASNVGKRKWDSGLIRQAIENGGGGWHGQGWLGRGKWAVSRSTVGEDGVCKCCGEKLVTIDLDPTETENFAKSVASIAAYREKHSSFEKFQQWLDYYGPFEAVVDAANVGLYCQKRFMPPKINTVVNAIRQMLPSKKLPLIVLHNKRVTGEKMDEPVNKAIIEKWKIADALYATPTGSNDDWYWLYAAIKYKCLLVTNDEMRDHTFQLLGNDFFPKWKERHQVRFSFSDSGPVFHMPPPCSVVIQESECGHWHIPVVSEHDSEEERMWLCVTRSNSNLENQSFMTRSKGRTSAESRNEVQGHDGRVDSRNQDKDYYGNLRNILSESVSSNHSTLLSRIEDAELFGECIIDFQI